MSLKIALQMDHPKSIHVEKDSTFVLGLEAQKRGYSLYYYSPDTLKLQNGAVSAHAAPLTFKRKKADHYSLGEFKETALKNFDMILMRQDFNDPVSYASTTHLLEHAKDQVLILNDPAGTRESPEKILITYYPDLAPPTLISRNLNDIYAFQKEHADLIMKPLNGFGGMDVYRINPDDGNLEAVFDMFCRLHRGPFVIQKFIPEVKQGDKRIIVVEGEPVAGVLRVPQTHSIRANLAVGGSAQIAEITDRDREICARLKPELVRRGLVFVGVDVIGDYVTEINPKSPTGLQHIYKLQGIKCEEAIWDAFENRLHQFKAAA